MNDTQINLECYKTIDKKLNSWFLIHKKWSESQWDEPHTSPNCLSRNVGHDQAPVFMQSVIQDGCKDHLKINLNKNRMDIKKSDTTPMPTMQNGYVEFWLED